METGAQQTRRSLCIGLLAHVDAGKTSITEQLLYRSGAIRSPGRVEGGMGKQAVTDRDRGIPAGAGSRPDARQQARIRAR